MKFEEFVKAFEDRVNQCRETLFAKNEEYSRKGNVFHNFYRAAAKRNVSVFEALKGMDVKHDVSIDDIINDLKEGKTVSMSVINQKLGDQMVYLFLLDGLFKECPLVLPAELPEGAKKLTELLGVDSLDPDAAKKKLIAAGKKQQRHRYKRGAGGRFNGSVKKNKKK